MNQIMFCRKKFILQNPYLYTFVITLVFSIMCLISFFRLSIIASFSPIAYSVDGDIDELYNSDCRYVRCNISKMYYTGYDYISHNKIAGHYYYTLYDDTCTIYLLSADYVGCPDSPPIMIENQSFNATLKKNDANFKPLLEYMSSDLNWNYSGMLRHTNTTIIDQRAYNISTYVLLAVLTFAGVTATLVTGILLWHHSDYVYPTKSSRQHHNTTSFDSSVDNKDEKC